MRTTFKECTNAIKRRNELVRKRSRQSISTCMRMINKRRKTSKGGRGHSSLLMINRLMMNSLRLAINRPSINTLPRIIRSRQVMIVSSKRPSLHSLTSRMRRTRVTPKRLTLIMIKGLAFSITQKHSLSSPTAYFASAS